MPANLRLVGNGHPISVDPVDPWRVSGQRLDYFVVAGQVDAIGAVLVKLGRKALRQNSAKEQHKSSSMARHATGEMRGAENSWTVHKDHG